MLPKSCRIDQRPPHKCKTEFRGAFRTVRITPDRPLRADTLKFEISPPIFSHAYQKGHKPSGFIFYCAYQTVFNGCIQYSKWLSLFLVSFIRIGGPPSDARRYICFGYSRAICILLLSPLLGTVFMSTAPIEPDLLYTLYISSGSDDG